MSGEIYIFAGGGTGGHLYPGLAVADELRRIRPEARIVFACSDRPVDKRILEPTPYSIAPQPVRPLPRNIAQLPGFLRTWFHSALRARELIRDLRPSAVLGLGGFAAAPACKRSSRTGVRTALLNPDAVPGRANRFLARYADAIFTQFEPTTDAFPPRLRERVRCVGCPVRGKLLHADRGEAIRHFDLRADRKTLLIFGGSLMSASINAAAAAMADELGGEGGEWQVLHVTGGAGDADPAGAYAGKLHARTLEYCRRMDLAYAAADLAICRGGASTIAELAGTATPAIILPYPHHRDQHQKHNAAALVEAGAAICITDAGNTPANVASLRATLLPLMSDPVRLERMRRAAKDVRRWGAAEEVARWLMG